MIETDKGLKIPVCINDAYVEGATMCMLPFIHMHTWPHGQVFPCCVYDWRFELGNVNDTNTSLETMFNNKKMKVLRKQLVDGKKPYGCRKCFEQEEEGISSFRLSANKRHHTKHVDVVHKAMENNYNINDFHLYYWDFRVDNLCNMTCRSCGPELSSKWHDDYYELHHDDDYKMKVGNKGGLISLKGKGLQEVHDIIDRDIDTVDHVYFAGGEPLINDMHYYILDKLIEHKRFDVEVYYNTNLLHLNYKKHNLIDLWSKFDKVDVAASIDAIGPRAEYLRHGTNWKKINGNLKTMLANKHIGFRVTPVISLFNALHMPDYIDHMMDLGFASWQISMGNVLINPESYALAMLPDHLKDQVRKTYDKFLEDKKGVYGERTLSDFRHKFESIINYLDASLGHQGTHEEMARRFIYMTRVLDRVRNENFVETYPELKDYWDACLEETDPDNLDPESDLFYF